MFYKKKAKEFIDHFYLNGDNPVKNAKFVVDQILESHKSVYRENKEMEWLKRPIEFWKSVKKEIKSHE